MSLTRLTTEATTQETIGNAFEPVSIVVHGMEADPDRLGDWVVWP